MPAEDTAPHPQLLTLSAPSAEELDRISLLDNFSWGNTDRPQHLGALVLASRALYEAGMGPLAEVVIITTVIGRTLVITSSLYVLLGVRLGVALPMLRSTLSWISHLQPWGMLDVFMLGVLVSFVKLAGMADVVLGPALYAFTGLIFVSAAAMSALEPRVLWQRLGCWH